MENKREPQAGETIKQLPGIEAGTIVLASKSPRRAEILRTVGLPFEIAAADIDESRTPNEAPHLYVERLAREKAEAVAVSFQTGRLVLGADTIVVAGGGEILGKPRDEADARRMLRLLSNGWHDVLTGVAIVRAQSETGEQQPALIAHEKTRVRFAQMSEAEINWYVASDEPFDKAGAYGVQGRAALFIEEIQGDYWNVVGLPVRLLYKLLARVV
ncbi:MAG: nucleoside triphosphate pyrophosphatase [Pyrinomonadaceae bacterium]